MLNSWNLKICRLLYYGLNFEPTSPLLVSFVNATDVRFEAYLFPLSGNFSKPTTSSFFLGLKIIWLQVTVVRLFKGKLVVGYIMFVIPNSLFDHMQEFPAAAYAMIKTLNFLLLCVWKISKLTHPSTLPNGKKRASPFHCCMCTWAANQKDKAI